MNKKDLMELKRNFSQNYDLCSLRRIMTAFVDQRKQIRYTKTEDAIYLSEDKLDILMTSLKKVLSGTLGKHFLQYDFPRQEYEEGGIQKMLYNAADNELSSEEECQELLKRIVDNFIYDGSYAVIIGSFAYTPITNEPTEYNFLICAICPVHRMESLLEFNEEADEITNLVSPSSCISKDPTDGFLFPMYSNRCTDVNGFMYYTKNPRTPNVSMIEDVMGCSFYMTGQAERDAFAATISDTVGDEMDYTMETQMNDLLTDFARNAERDNVPPIISARELADILVKSGAAPRKLENMPQIFDMRTSGAQGLHVSNLINSKTTVKTADISITADCQANDLIRTDIINGKPCIVIEVTDPAISVNDLNILIPRR